MSTGTANSFSGSQNSHYRARGLLNLTLLVMCLPIMAYAQTPMPDFGDVPSTHAYYSYVQYLRERSITLGVDGINYEVDNTLKRQEAAAFVVRAVFWATSGSSLGKDLNGSGTAENPGYAYATQAYFGDTGANVPQSTFRLFFETQKAKELGIINGYTVDLFTPTQLVSRAQMIAYAVRAMEVRTRGAAWQRRNYGDENQWYFSDVPPGHAGHALFHEIWKAQQMGVITGDCKPYPAETPSDALNEGQPISRGEAAKYMVTLTLGVSNPVTLRYTSPCPPLPQQCQGQSGIPASSLGRESIRGLGRTIATEVIPVGGFGESALGGGFNGGSTVSFQVWPSAWLDTATQMKSSPRSLCLARHCHDHRGYVGRRHCHSGHRSPRTQHAAAAAVFFH